MIEVREMADQASTPQGKGVALEGRGGDVRIEIGGIAVHAAASMRALSTMS